MRSAAKEEQLVKFPFRLKQGGIFNEYGIRKYVLFGEYQCQNKAQCDFDVIFYHRFIVVCDFDVGAINVIH